MQHPGFYTRAGPFPLKAILDWTGDALPPAADPAMEIADIRPLEVAGPRDISFFDNAKYAAQFRATRAGACFVAERFAARAPAGTVALVTAEPYRSFARAMALFYPQAMRPLTATAQGWDGDRTIHPSALLEEGATVEPGAVIGAEARIGRGTTIAAGAVIGYRVHIGRDSFIGPGVHVTHALVGDRVILHAGVAVGQDGFGFAMGAKGHLKVPQIGRVIIQDDVEIGANSTIDRGTLSDTIIGEGTKIDNLVQVGHNVVIGRHCVIVAQCALAGSAELGDFVVMGGQAGVLGHLKVGHGAQIAGSSHVREDVPAGERWGGTPAKPVRNWFREITALKRLAERSVAGHTKDEAPRGEGG